jgi:hypothetical protein
MFALVALVLAMAADSVWRFGDTTLRWISDCHS